MSDLKDRYETFETTSFQAAILVEDMWKRIEELERRWDALPWEEMENHIEWWDRPTRSLEIILKILAAREEGNE